MGDIKLETIHFILIAGGAVLGIIIGLLVAGSFMRKALTRKAHLKIKEADVEAEKIKNEKILQAKEKFLQLKSEHEKHVNEKNQQLNTAENKIKQKEQGLSQKQEQIQRKDQELDALRSNLTNQLEIIEFKKSEIEKAHKRQVEQLEKISGLSGEDAK